MAVESALRCCENRQSSARDSLAVVTASKQFSSERSSPRHDISKPMERQSRREQRHPRRHVRRNPEGTKDWSEVRIRPCYHMPCGKRRLGIFSFWELKGKKWTQGRIARETPCRPHVISVERWGKACLASTQAPFPTPLPTVRGSKISAAMPHHQPMARFASVGPTRDPSTEPGRKKPPPHPGL